MKIYFYFPLLILSLALAFIVTFLHFREMPFNLRFFETGESWAVLAFDENEDDRLIANILSSGAYDGFYSESGQQVFINDFYSVKTVQLDRFDGLLESFDPRNDGYAQKIRSFFLREGKRFFYVPLSNTRDFKSLNALLDDFPHEAALLGRERNFFLNLILAGAALLVALLLCREKTVFSLMLPLLFSIAWIGPSGLCFAGLLTGIALIMPDLEPLLKKRTGNEGKYLSALYPLRFHLFFSVLILLMLVVFAAIGAIPVLTAVSGTVFLVLLEFLCLLAKRKSKPLPHFQAVWILPKKEKYPAFGIKILPLAFASLFLLLAPDLMPGIFAKGGEVNFSIDDYVNIADYEKHFMFQNSFSQKPLNSAESFSLEYYLAEDGLINAYPQSEAAGLAMPPFPLEKLRAFLIDYNDGSIKEPSKLLDWVFMFILPALCCVNLLQGIGFGAKKKTAFDRAGYSMRVSG